MGILGMVCKSTVASVSGRVANSIKRNLGARAQNP